MKNTSLLMLLIFAVPFRALSSESVQIDWSGGGGLGGPVAQWGDQYHWAHSVCTDITGEVTLGALVNPQIDTLNVVCGETSKWADVNNDGYTDAVCLNTPRDSLYWLENPAVPGEQWARHHIASREHIWDFGEVIYEGQFYGVAVAYTIPYEDETQVGVFYYPSSGYNWMLMDIGILGEKNYTVTLETGDLDNNGYPDIVAAEWAYDNVAVWWNCSAGVPETILQPHTPYVKQLEDCDGDGDLEVFIETGWIPSSRIYWNTASGFQCQYIGDCYYTGTKAVADLDGGEYHEIAFSMFEDLYIYRHMAEDGWVLQQIASFTSVPLFYDINTDGDQDIVTCHGGELTYLYNLGQGNAWREGRLSGGYPSRIAATDIDGDSVPDITLYSPGGPAYWFLPQGEGYASSGFLESTWLCPETDPAWNSITYEWLETPETQVSIQVRTTDDLSSPPDWSPELPSGADITPYCSEDEEYFQYRLNLFSNSPDETPTVTAVFLNWTSPVEGSQEGIPVIFAPLFTPSRNPRLLVRLPEGNSCRIDVFDIAGRLCRFEALDLSPGEEGLCVLSNLPAGVYHARLHSGTRELYTRFVVATP